MGALVQKSGSTVVIEGGKLHAPKRPIDAGNSGTTLRLASGIVSMFDEKTVITGDESLRKRPMGPLLDALSQMGVECSSDNGKPPVEIKGSNKGGKVFIDGSISSQFISSLMLVSPMAPNNTEIVMKGNIVSRPYLDVTAHMMKVFGVGVSMRGNTFNIKGNTGYKPCNYEVPVDFSSAAFPLVAGALNGCVIVKGLQMDDPQGDRVIVDILRDVGASVHVMNDCVAVGSEDLYATDVNVGQCPDLFPILAVLLSTARGTSRLCGAPQLKFKESDRIASTVNMIKSIGGDATATDDGCIIKGKTRLRGGTVDNLGDHRIMMAAAVASLVCENPVIMDGVECCSISYPKFINDMRYLGLRSEVI
jgi:3-phosphoshikimate 1-carboxyvinyltransferase